MLVKRASCKNVPSSTSSNVSIHFLFPVDNGINYYAEYWQKGNQRCQNPTQIRNEHHLITWWGRQHLPRICDSRLTMESYDCVNKCQEENPWVGRIQSKSGMESRQQLRLWGNTWTSGLLPGNWDLMNALIIAKNDFHGMAESELNP